MPPLSAPDFLLPHLTRPVAVFGAGVSGGGVAGLLAALGVAAETYDARGAVFTAAAAPRHRLVVFSPGFAPDHPWLGLAREAGAECLGELDFASLFWRGRVVAVTGTNGKTTLTEFLVHALTGGGVEAHAVGNIGRPFSALVTATSGGSKAAVAVCEVSSFQAETLRHFRAGATLWTNFAEDHIDRHAALEGYFAAKWNLVARTLPPGAGAFTLPGASPPRKPAATVFVGASVPSVARRFGRSLAAVRGVETAGQPPDPLLAPTVFARYPQRENFILAAAWWREAGGAPEALYAAARTYPGSPHRLRRVLELDDVTYWNDSKATNFHAVEAALAGFSAPVVWIGGGKSKGGDVAGFMHRIAPRVRHALLLGETGAELAAACADVPLAHTVCATLAEAVQRAADFAAPGGQVVLSPGFASFDLFRSYEDRGCQFETLVRNLGVAAARLR